MRRSITILLTALLVCAGTGAQATPLPARPDCQREGGLQPLCAGFRGPEDIEPLPDGQALIVSEDISQMQPGALSLYVPATGERQILYAAGYTAGSTSAWGAPNCPGPVSARLAPHGISLRSLGGDSLALAVVNHAERESIELFEVIGQGTQWRVQWRGCVPAPAGANFNDVAWFGDGLLVTQTVEVGPSLPAALYHWSRPRGFSEVAGTRGVYPNGVVVTADGRSAIINYFRGNEVRRVDLYTGRIEARLQLPHPDNSSWTPRGTLLIASNDFDVDYFVQCLALPAGACAVPYRIYEVDAQLREATLVHSGGSSLMGGGTVAVRVGDSLYIGSVVGDRVLRVTLPSRKALHRHDERP